MADARRATAQVVGFVVGLIVSVVVSIMVLGGLLLGSTGSLFYSAHALVVPLVVTHKTDTPTGAVAGTLTGSCLAPLLGLASSTVDGQLFAGFYFGLVVLFVCVGAVLGHWLHERGPSPSA